MGLATGSMDTENICHLGWKFSLTNEAMRLMECTLSKGEVPLISIDALSISTGLFPEGYV